MTQEYSYYGDCVGAETLARVGLSYLKPSGTVEPSILDSSQMENVVDFRIVYSIIYCGYQN